MDYGWKLHIVVSMAAVWIPLAALLTPANEADNEVAPALIRELPPEVKYLRGDKHYNAPNVQQAWESGERILVTPQYGPYPFLRCTLRLKSLRDKILHKQSKISPP